MKKFLALLLAALMVFSLVACGGNNNQPAAGGNDKPATGNDQPAGGNNGGNDAPSAGGPALSADGRYPAKTVKIGFLNYDTTSELWLAINDCFKELAKTYNFEIMASESLDSAEAELDFIDACAAAGCDAVYGYYNVSNEQALLKCAEYGMYYYGQGANEAFHTPEVLANPYYLGSFTTGNAEYEYGYACIEMLAEAGCHKIAGASGGKNFGVQMFIDRWQGAMDAIADLQAKGTDIELVYEVAGFPGTDGSFEAGQTAVLGMDEVDGIYSTLTALMWIQPMQEAGKFGVVKVAAAGESMSEAAVGMFGAGFYVGTATEIMDTFCMAVPVIINAVEGHPIREANGDAAMIPATWWRVHNVEEAGFYASVQGGENGWAITAEDMRPLLYEYNPDVTIQDYADLYTSMTMDEILARHAG